MPDAGPEADPDLPFTLEGGREILVATPEALRSRLQGLSDAWTSVAESPEQWTPWQVLAHLTHIEETDWIDRTQVILRHGPDRPFDPVDREAGSERFAGLSMSEVLDRFAGAREANLRTLDTLVGPDDLDRPGRHPEFGLVTLGQLLATWVVHDLNHTGQIVKTLAKRYADAVGPWRAFLPIVDAP
jgi:hypothetical protein